VAIFPFILNAKYMSSGLEQTEDLPNDGLVPSLERPPELPPITGDENQLVEKTYPDLESSRDT
jgi:hypothetical protein